MASAAGPTSYDEVPYPSYPMPQTHPDHLATLATLLGLDPPPSDRCRVLELGCASGGNIIPLALTLPESSFVGVDLSQEQIADGQRVLDALGLKNIELRRQSILDVDESLGSFDYILCHGVYSWVPPPVQEKILRIVASQLVPNGVGYVSYNTHPGWHLRGMVRAMMRYHVGRFPDDSPETRVHRARSLLAFLIRAAPAQDRSYVLALREQTEQLAQHSDAYLFHEHLEEHNEPVWFLEFCERMAALGLRYLAEAEFSSMVASTSFPPDVQAELNDLAPHLIEKEQYMDFVRNRTFRQTLICHDHLRPCYEVRADRLSPFHFASPVRPKSPDADLTSESAEEFAAPSGLSVTTSMPVVKAAFACLGEIWPEAVPFDDLLARARGRLHRPNTPDAGAENEDSATLTRSLLTAYASTAETLVELFLRPPRFFPRASDRPLASPLARFQSAANRPVTNLRHDVVKLTPFDRHLLPLLDGTRDRTKLLEELLELHQCGKLSISQEEEPITDSARARAILADVLEQQLPKLARAALLSG